MRRTAVSFCVPSANFGNVFAGYMAYKMGLPVKQFIIATNANDILHRTLAANDFSKRAGGNAGTFHGYRRVV